MAYNDDAVLAKLSALNETQESIVSIVLASQVIKNRKTNLIYRLLSLNGSCFIGREMNFITSSFICTNLICYVGDMPIVRDNFGFKS